MSVQRCFLKCSKGLSDSSSVPCPSPCRRSYSECRSVQARCLLHTSSCVPPFVSQSFPSTFLLPLLCSSSSLLAGSAVCAWLVSLPPSLRLCRSRQTSAQLQRAGSPRGWALGPPARCKCWKVEAAVGAPGSHGRHCCQQRWVSWR